MNSKKQLVKLIRETLEEVIINKTTEDGLKVFVKAKIADFEFFRLADEIDKYYIHKDEVEEIREKAWKYDGLCK